MTSVLLDQAKNHALHELAAFPSNLTYHNQAHTEQVVKAAETIGRASNLTTDELESVLIAAWLHDIGYKDGCQGHEATSAKIANDLLIKWGATKEKAAQVSMAILATAMPQQPKNLLEQVLCDADLAHLADENIEEISDKLRHEFMHTQQKIFSDEEWHGHNYQFLKTHSYFTPYAQVTFGPGKKKNIKRLKKKNNLTGNEDYLKELEKELERLRKKNDKRLYPERGIETMFRVTAENHMTLGSMADTKANIMISINAIILSLIVSVLFRKLEEFPNLLIPTLLLVGVCLSTVVFAVLSVRPHITSGKFSKEDIQNKKTNLLFFGNFHSMKLQDYQWGMHELMNDAEYLYGSLIKDIYFNGKVLAKKYRYLRISYNIFMFGFVASNLAFIIALLLYYYPPFL